MKLKSEDSHIRFPIFIFDNKLHQANANELLLQSFLNKTAEYIKNSCMKYCHTLQIKLGD